MAGRRRFACGHLGKGRYCHRCEHKRRHREARDVDRSGRRDQRAAVRSACGIDLRGLPGYVQDKAATVIDTLAKGQPLDVPARRMAFDRTRLSMPLTDDYRLLLVQEAKCLRPVAVVGHERYDAMAKNAAIKGW
jgi:hypothetical protein